MMLKKYYKSFICIVIIIIFIFIITSCTFEEDNKKYGPLLSVRIGWKRQYDDSIKNINEWSTNNPEAKIEHIQIISTSQYNEGGYIYIFYRLPYTD